MRILFLFLLLVFNVDAIFGQDKSNILLFTKTTGFRHESIPKGIKTITGLLDSVGIRTVHTEDANYFCKDSLAKFDAVIFLNTTGDLFTEDQKRDFQSYIQSGKGYIGIHAASDTEFNWPWYGQLVGGYFSSHPAVQDAQVHIHNNKHLSTAHLGKTWLHRDEWYDFKNMKPGLNVLMTVDEESYEGGQMGKFHPIAWFQEFDGGRSFYTGLGHTDESYDSSKFRKHVLGGIFYVLQAKK